MTDKFGGIEFTREQAFEKLQKRAESAELELTQVREELERLRKGD
jgi:hypothetical protein